MSANISTLNPDKPKRVLLVASGPAVSKQTGWPIGVWASELVHPYYEFVENGYDVIIASPDGGKLQFDGYSDPRDPSGYSAHDILSLGFISSLAHMKLVENTPALDQLNPADYDAVFFCGGQGPMYTFYGNAKVSGFAARAYEAGKVLAVICHGTCLLLEARLSNGDLVVKGKTWTGFADSEEAYADGFAGQRIQPFWIEEEAKKLKDSNFVVSARFQPFAVRDGRLITGQQQFSGTKAARLVIEALGV